MQGVKGASLQPGVSSYPGSSAIPWLALSVYKEPAVSLPEGLGPLITVQGPQLARLSVGSFRLMSPHAGLCPTV